MQPMSSHLPLLPSEKLFQFRAEQQSAANHNSFLGSLPNSDADLLRDVKKHNIDPRARQALLSHLLPYWDSLSLGAGGQSALKLIQQVDTQIIMTGQQPALFGGPLMILSKAISAAMWAKHLQSLGVPAVAIFWIADEDHDVSELDSGKFESPALRHLKFEKAFSESRKMISELRLGSSLAEGAQAIENLLKAHPHFEGLQELLSCFDQQPSKWFRSFLLKLLGDCPILSVEPGLLRELAAPILAKEAASPALLQSELLEQMDEMRSLQLPVPIGQVNAFPFFALDSEGQRHRLAEENGVIRTKSENPLSWKSAELPAFILENPKSFSPDALLRPLVQDQLFQPFMTILGPTEYAYQLQLSQAYQVRGIQRPLLTPRMRVQLVPENLSQKLLELDIQPSEWIASKKLASYPSPQAQEWKQALAKRATDISNLLQSQIDADVSQALRKRLERTLKRWTADFAKLDSAYERELNQGVDEQRKALQELHHEVWPGGSNAERSVNTFDFLIRYGMGLVEQIQSSWMAYEYRSQLISMKSLEWNMPNNKASQLEENSSVE